MRLTASTCYRSYDPKHPTCRSCVLDCSSKAVIQPTEPKKSKYGNQKIVVDGITFDSKKEAARYQQLRMLEKSGQITNLALQQPFDLAPSVTVCGKKKPPLRYIADFVYRKQRAVNEGLGELVVEDAKGFRDKVYILKRHLMKSVHGIDILET